MIAAQFGRDVDDPLQRSVGLVRRRVRRDSDDLARRRRRSRPNLGAADIDTDRSTTRSDSFRDPFHGRCHRGRRLAQT